jgi:hypothetical protein
MSKLASIKKIGNNDFTLNVLVTQLRTSLGVLPFVGAGLSMLFGFSGWQDFLLGRHKQLIFGRRFPNGFFDELLQPDNLA